jgi:hypothetical protein
MLESPEEVRLHTLAEIVYQWRTRMNLERTACKTLENVKDNDKDLHGPSVEKDVHLKFVMIFWLHETFAESCTHTHTQLILEIYRRN